MAEAGNYEVYVRAFPDNGTKVLFYRTEDQRIMVTNYIVRGESFIVDKPRVWFGKQLADVGLAVNYDLAPDGQRFLVVMPAESPEPRDRREAGLGK